MALWFSMAVNGLDAYRDAVKAGIDIASYAAAKIEEHPDLDLVLRPDLSIVLFRRNGWVLTDYERWSQQLLQQQVAFVTPSAWSGEPVGRLAFLHPSTTHEMVDEVFATL